MFYSLIGFDDKLLDCKAYVHFLCSQNKEFKKLTHYRPTERTAFMQMNLVKCSVYFLPSNIHQSCLLLHKEKERFKFR